MDHVPMKIHQASTVDHQHQWRFHQKHMTANVVNPKHVTNESRVICTPPRSPRLIWRKNSWMALNDAMPKIKTWYWSMESGFAWNPPLLRGPRRYGNGAAMKTMKKSEPIRNTSYVFRHRHWRWKFATWTLPLWTSTEYTHRMTIHASHQNDSPALTARHPFPQTKSCLEGAQPFRIQWRLTWKLKVASVAWRQTTKSVHFTNVFLKRPSTYRRLVSQKTGLFALDDTAHSRRYGGQLIQTDGLRTGGYGVISLFDGVSTVVPLRSKKLNCPPSVIVLAEINEPIRHLASTEFGYNIDETWGRSFTGTPAIYVKDVNTILAKSCRILLQAVKNRSYGQVVYSWRIPVSGSNLCRTLSWAIGSG